jgi:hypothetical protein
MAQSRANENVSRRVIEDRPAAFSFFTHHFSFLTPTPSPWDSSATIHHNNV